MINVVLVGAGMVSMKHIQAWLIQQDAKIVYVVDHNLDKAAAAAQVLGIKEYGADYHEIISSDSIDAVDICVTANEHVDVATFASNSGKHVLLEKPIATTLTDADLIIEAAASNGVKLMLGHTHHFYDYGISAKEIIDSGEIGHPIYIRHVAGGGFWPQDWTGNRINPERTGGNVVDNGVHIVDMINWWMDSKPVSVYAQALNPTSSHIDMNQYFLMTLKYQNDGIGIVDMSRANMPTSNEFSQITVLGTEGEIRTGSDVNTQWVYREDGLLLDNGGFQDGFNREIDAFVKSIIKDVDPPVGGLHSKIALATCLAAEVSIKTGSVIAIK